MRKILSIMIFRTRKAGSTYPNLPKFDKRDVKYYEEIGKHIFLNWQAKIREAL